MTRASKKSNKSIEPNIADLANGWLKSYKLDYRLEQASLNTEIDKALDDYYSKNGGIGGNRPDVKLLLQSSKNGRYYPVLIEYKGHKDKLEKLDADGNVENRNAKNEPIFKNINGYAVNGAVHYANAVLHHTSYTDIIAVGMTGYKDEQGEIRYEIGVYYVSKSNLGVGQRVGDFNDFSFLAAEHFEDFISQVEELSLTPEELDRLKEKREKEIDASLTKLNNDIYQNEKGLGENDRVYLVAAAIIATIGIPGKVAPLEKSDLKSSNERGWRDGDILMRKIESFLEEKALPKEKKEMILRTLSNTLLTENINKVHNGETQLKRVFTKIVDDLGIYYKIGLTTDFTGKLFNEMYSWLGFTQDKLNDVVLTPSYVATLLAKLARVNKDSYVWDFATGSAGLLVAAMNEMLIDAKNSISSPEELRKKEAQIKAEQLLGLELLSSVYMLAILNMILMGDGSSNILNKDSLTDFDGKYGFGKTDHKFPADAFILNPPYSANGNGMNFVERALNMMEKGYAAIIIQNSAGSGKAREINKRILQNNTLLASIKMPLDLFIGKSSVQTNIYVFKVGEAHEKDETVKFIDFSNDGYTRTNRKKASNNLKDTGNARGRYAELVQLVRFGKKYDYGAKFNRKEMRSTKIHLPIKNGQINLDFMENFVAELEAYLSAAGLKDYTLTTEEERTLADFGQQQWGRFNLHDLFGRATRGKRLKSDDRVSGSLPFVTAGEADTGISAFIGNPVHRFKANTVTIDMFGSAKYRNYEYGADDHVAVVHTDELEKMAVLFITSAIHKAAYTGEFHYGRNFYAKDADNLMINLPVKDGGPDYTYMQTLISAVQKQVIKDVVRYADEKIAATKTVTAR